MCTAAKMKSTVLKERFGFVDERLIISHLFSKQFSDRRLIIRVQALNQSTV